MKADKKKLFEAIREKKTSDIVLTYSPNDFEFTNRDFTFEFGGLQYRSFSSDNSFEIVSNITEEGIETESKGFLALRKKLQK